MNLDELIEALQDLKQSGKEIGKLPVEFYRRKKTNKSVDQIKFGTSMGCLNRIELHQKK